MSDALLAGAKPDREFCSTSDAAQMLGVSLGTVQQMVENGLLDAWKTAGGHRRIRISSVEAFLRKRQAGPAGRPQPATRSGELHILVAEDDRLMQTLYEKTFANWEMPVRLQVVASGLEGLVEIGRNPPDLLVADLVMPDLDGFAMIRKLRADPRLTEMDIIVVTGLSQADIDEQGGLPEDVLVYAKPIPFRELKGYVQARLMQMHRRQA